MNWDLIIDIAVKLIIAIVITYLLPLLKSWLDEKIGSEKAESINKIIKSLVLSVEQVYKEESGAVRKEIVLDKLTTLGYEITDEIDAMIEANVYEMKK